VEQAAVVRGHAYEVVALVDELEHAFEAQPDLAHGAREGRARVHAVAHLFADAAHAVVVVARIAHGQQVAVFGVEQKQQPVQQHQRGLAHFVEVGARELARRKQATARGLRLRVQVGARERVGQLREDVVEHARAQVLRDFFFVQARLVERQGVQAAARVVPGLRQKGAALEKQHEEPQCVLGRGVVGVRRHAGHAGHTQRGGKVDLENSSERERAFCQYSRHTAPLVRMPHCTARSLTTSARLR